MIWVDQVHVVLYTSQYETNSMALDFCVTFNLPTSHPRLPPIVVREISDWAPAELFLDTPLQEAVGVSPSVSAKS